MKRFRFLLLLILSFTLVTPAGWASPDEVYVARVEGIIAPSLADFFVSAIRKAEDGAAHAIVFELDTPGGLDTSMRIIIKEILRSPAPVIIYVSPSGARAASAGAFITIAAHVAAMAPGTNIGAAHPVQMGGGEADEEMTRKIENDAAAYIRGLAERRGRNATWAEDAVRKSVSATATEALRLKVIDVVAENRADLLAKIDGRTVETGAGRITLKTKMAKIVEVEMGLRDKVLSVISNPTIAYILLILGMAGLYFELSTPGAILPGVLGGICLILAFYAFQALPINYAGLLLIILGVILFVAEVKVVSNGILTIGGMTAMILGSLMLIDSPAPFLQISLSAILGVTAATTAFFVFAIGAVFRAHRRQPATGREGLVGQAGVARTRLNPDGLIFIRGEIWNATCAEGVEPGEQVQVTSVAGLKLKVKKLP
ncbi:MAG: membrane-bound serine protease, membrane-bound serine protease (ClpP class) [candidate division NC10 bacterium CSP1-5]|nr:MAG: membrane-bound serine protease, membrane-bound serine protease (ClpP class) [candidate division NC10 bacterium CSP1-5]